MSSLGKPELLEHVSVCLHAVRRLFRNISHPNSQPRPSDFYIKKVISHEEFKAALVRMGAQISSSEADTLCHTIDKNGNGIDYLEWLETLDPTSPESEALFLLGKSLSKDKQLPSLNAQELQDMKNLYALAFLISHLKRRITHVCMYCRLHELAEFAELKRVRLMIDAEQTYLQPAIDHCVHQLQRRMNRSFPTIYNTFQCYLTDAPSRIKLDLERARQGG
jgi:proline dehydrogenase